MKNAKSAETFSFMLRNLNDKVIPVHNRNTGSAW